MQISAYLHVFASYFFNRYLFLYSACFLTTDILYHKKEAKIQARADQFHYTPHVVSVSRKPRWRQSA